MTTPKLNRDGLPVDARDWTEEDWATLYRALETVKREVSARHRPAEKTRQEALDEMAAEFMAARGVIDQALREWRFGIDGLDRDRYARAIIARLAQHDPPIITGFARVDPCEHCNAWEQRQPTYLFCPYCGRDLR